MRAGSRGNQRPNSTSSSPATLNVTPNSLAATSYQFSNGQLTSVTDANAKTISYLYNDAGQVACIAYPVSTGATCGTNASPAAASVTNTIQTLSYDSSGRLESTTDWLGKTVQYGYGDARDPGSPTSINYLGSTAIYSYDAVGNLIGLGAGPSVADSWSYNADEQLAATTMNGVSSGTVAYNANHQITAATNLGTSTNNDTYTLASNGEVTRVVPGTGTASSSSFNNGDELCSVTTGMSAKACGTSPANGTSYAFNANGQRSSTTTYVAGSPTATQTYAWNSLGELCNEATTATACGVAPSSGTSYQYNADGLRTNATTSTSATASTWDVVSGGSLPLDINDSLTNSSGTTNTSYLYGDLLFGGSAPVEQITTTSAGSSASFLVANPTGVQEVFSSSGAVQELAVYSPYGVQTLKSGTDVTPFGFQGSYTDSTGFIYLVNRYYDPSTDSFISVDPMVQQTDQPYAYVNDDPLNFSDSLGLCARTPNGGCYEASSTPRDSGNSSSTKKVSTSTASSAKSTTSLSSNSNVFSSPTVGALGDSASGASTIVSQDSSGTPLSSMSDIEVNVTNGLETFSEATTVVAGYGTSLDDLNGGHGVIYSFFDGLIQVIGEVAAGFGGAAACAPLSPVMQAACAASAGYVGGQFMHKTFRSWFG